MSAIPLLGRATPHMPVAWRAGRVVTAARFLADVRALAARLPAGRHVLNVCNDRYAFAVAFAAALVAGRSSVLPSSLAPLAVRDDKTGWFTLGEWSDLAFGPGQLVLMRKDPPVDAEYVYDTQVLDLARLAGAQVVNDPRGLRDYNEKLAAMLFPQCCPPTRISRDPADLKAFAAEQGKVVLKLTITAGGQVADCQIVSSELKSPELERKLLARIKQFDFGSKSVETMVITYPIDFLPS